MILLQSQTNVEKKLDKAQLVSPLAMKKRKKYINISSFIGDEKHSTTLRS